MSTPGSPPDRGRKRPSGTPVDAPRHPSPGPRPLYPTGGIAAATAAGIGLAVIVTLTIVGWVAAPHSPFGEEVVELLQGAVLAWLVSHHVSFAIEGGQFGLLPIGLVLIPALLLYRSGRWLARSCEIGRLRHVYRAALAIAGPYAAIAGTLALLARTDTMEPSMPRALVMGFVIAFLAGGLGSLRQMMRDRDVAVGALLGLMPGRARSLLVGMGAATGSLLLGGLLLFLAALAVNLPEAVDATRALAPGLVGGTLLLLVQIAYLPNAIVFAVCYALGPGFTMGEATIVAPTGVSVGALPMFPMLAALPTNGAAPVASLAALAVPFVAGAVGGVLTQRSAPDVVSEAAPLWGFVCGVTTGMVCAALGELAGGSLGAERLTDIGPSSWQVGLVAALEVGVAAAIAAWIANWWYTRRMRLAFAAAAEAPVKEEPGKEAEAELPEPVPVGEGLATVTPLRPREDDEDGAEQREPSEAERFAERQRVRERAREEKRAERAARKEARAELRVQRREERRAQKAQKRRSRREDGDAESEEMYGISYEADPEEVDAP
ncbi:cell division protein PerM [Nocardiopsis sp. EMB25]|uniref:cell division protein PerM n=1 Tax=Nocardiopsis sp. EMB25 TaxID=2835867 RepID=UPI003FA3B20A